MLVSEILDKAADLIEPEGAWTQKANARDSEGCRTFATSENAACFCMAGAVIRASGGGYPAAYVRKVLPRPAAAIDQLVAFNDSPSRTQAEVVAKLREAAELARAQGQ